MSDTSSRIGPKKLHAPFLQGDDRGGNVASQNIVIHNACTGEVITSHMAEPASTDPSDPVNISGKFRERRKKEWAKINSLNPNLE